MPSKIIEKYAKNKTPEEMEKEQDELEKEYHTQSKALEQNILKFSSKTDKLEDPETGETLAEVKRPTSSQYQRTIPPELAKYKDKPEEIPYELAQKYQDDLYKLMEEMIVKPKHSAEWWKEHTGGRFMALFQAHIVNIYNTLQEDINSFLQPTTGTRS